MTNGQFAFLHAACLTVFSRTLTPAAFHQYKPYPSGITTEPV